MVSLKTPAMLLDRAVGIAGAVDRAVGRAIAEGDLAAILEPLQRVGVGEVIALGMGDRDLDHLARLVAVGEQALAGLDLEVHVAADELELLVAHQHARQQAGLGGDLEAVADGQHRHALGAARFLTSAITGDCAAMAPQRR